MGGKEAEEKKDVEEKKELLEIRENGKKMDPPPPPDGGWGWVVVVSSFLCNMVLDGIGYSFGILLEPLQEYYKGTGKGTISMVGSILTGFIMLVGPISSSLVNKFGARLTCIAGALISAISIFISTFSPNVYLLMVSYGMLGGFGLGLMYVPAVTTVGYWFEKKRSLVTGISTCGSGFGTIVFAPVVTGLLEITDWQWTNRIIAGFCLMCTLLGLTMKPVPRGDGQDDDSITEAKKQNAIKAFNASKEELDFIDNNEEAVKIEHKNTDVEEKGEKNGYITVLRNIPFLLVFVANLPAVMGLYIPYMYLPGITQQRGLSKAESALLISLIGFFNTGGRIVSGLIADRPGVDALFMTFLALLTGAFCPFLMTLCYNFWSYAVVCIMFGITLSAWPALSSTMLVELLGLELLTSAFGVLTMIRGAGAFLGAPFGGFVLDAVGARTDMGNFTLAATMDEASEQFSSTESPSITPDLAYYEVAFWISAVLLGISALGHGFAFCYKKALTRRSSAAV